MTRTVIRCPYCAAEYLPGEIFIPKYFLGQPKEVVKDYQGHILDVVQGIDPDLTENYRCDKCNNIFKVVASITYTTETYLNFKDSYTQQL